jgi:TetR/AcrR family transcriptional repressor of mexJK operon
MLSRYFARPDVRAQMRPDVPFDVLPCALMSAVAGEQMMSFMRPQCTRDPVKAKRDLEGRLELFYRGILP